MKIVNWNIERNAPESWQAKSLVHQISNLSPDVVCLTEAWTESLVDLNGYSICSDGAAFSKKLPNEKKVLLWSKHPWEDVQEIPELEEIGGAIAGFTRCDGALRRIVGICVPYHMARLANDAGQREPWKLHLEFLERLSRRLQSWEDENISIVLGDFNRRIPSNWGSKVALDALIDCFKHYDILTTGDLSGTNERTIDHIAFRGQGKLESLAGLNRKAENGRARTDHDGVFATLTLS